MNDSPNTSWPALVNDVEAELPEHFNWGALALQRPRSAQETATGPAGASTGRNDASPDDRPPGQTVPPTAEPDFRPNTGLVSFPDAPATTTAGTIDPAPEAHAARNDASPLLDVVATERPIAIDRGPLPVTTPRRLPLPLPGDRILRLRFSDVGEPSEPGEHPSLYGLVEITRSDLAVWNAYPEAVFTVIRPSPYSTAAISRLGTFEV
ncbi:hypothetical protein JQ617_25635 [Bradyrhizobium sp. KB893862 SZCCT0404]|uniref:hypothetical protein n=1 Tax=Bradyrhizobium sp. KB893862 SZCCT0404 TaxID=2807672 RepID=UPI001BA8F362|nr:hypothetical protein [Bradyrhizobium sp. KB893862 SZCCT0404]MBR1177361.1 hypothetical protein [Bradyrhizobium sp. KB893862 SZCCT0404]